MANVHGVQFTEQSVEIQIVRAIKNILWVSRLKTVAYENQTI